MKVLILGAEGQVGRALIATATTRIDTIALSRAGCDVGDRTSILRAIDEAAPDLVFNAAAYTAVDMAETDASHARQINEAAVGWIAEATTRRGARLVHVSTDFVFDGTASKPYATDALTGPLNIYGHTKLGGETAALAASDDNLVVRTSWVYAATGRNFVLTMLRLMAERDEVRVVSDQVGSPTYALALAEALWDLIAVGACGVQHVTDAGVASWYDFAVAIAEEGVSAGVLKKMPRVVPIFTDDYPTSALRPAFSVLDKRGTVALIGRPLPHWRESLRRMINEVRALG